MRLLIVHPGADWAVSDIHDGYVAAFKSLGHDVGVYNLSVRLMRAHGWLNYCWRQAGRPEEKPHPVEVIRQASGELVPAALRGDVDWVFIISGMYLDPDALILLQRAGKRVALLLTESPYEDDRQIRAAKHADVVFTNERISVDKLRAVNPNVYYLPHAYDPAKHNPHLTISDEDRVPAHDVVFVGTGFQERLDILSGVDWSGIDLGLYGSFELLGSRSKLRQYIRGAVVENDHAAKLYRRAKIGLNLYRQSSTYERKAERITNAESMNPRALELGACGVFTLSDYRPEVSEVFGGLVPTFRNSDELETMLRAWLADEDGRRAIAEQLPTRVTQSSYRSRAIQISRLLIGVSSEIIGYDGHTGESPAGALMGTRSACLVGV